MDVKRKQIAYGEGVIDGFGEAQEIIRNITSGHLLLQEPSEVTGWRSRISKLRDELADEEQTRD